MSTALRQKTRVTAFSLLLICLAIFLTAYTTRRPEVGRVGANLSDRLLSPLQRSLVGAARWWGGLAERYLLLIDAQDENKQLRSRLTSLGSLHMQIEELQATNRRLREILEMKEEQYAAGIVATVTAYNPSRWVEGVTVNRGSSDGVKEGMAVVNEAGVVGQVVATSSGTARVLLVIDRVAGVDALVQSSRSRGVVRGRGEDECELEYIVASEQLEVGQRVITSGLDGVYPKGFLIGHVSKVENDHKGMFQQIKVDPVVDFERLEHVLIVTATSLPHEMLIPPAALRGEIQREDPKKEVTNEPT
jgi:rod shape-determining protein MreC